MHTGDIIFDIVSFCGIVKPRWPEKPGGGASIWKRDPVGTFGQYFKSRYDTLKYCGFVIYD